MNEKNCNHDWEITRNLVPFRVMKGIVNVSIVILYSITFALLLFIMLDSQWKAKINLILIIALKTIGHIHLAY